MVVLVGIVLVTGEPLTWQWLLLVPALTLQTVFNTGLAMVMARLGAKLSDLKQVMPFVHADLDVRAPACSTRSSLFDRAAAAGAATLVECNPLLVYIELARYALLE